jgi:ankyrin repeat protein
MTELIKYISSFRDLDIKYNILDPKSKMHLKTLLHRAIEKSKIEFATQLIEKGANVNIKDGEGNTALHLAVKKGNKEIIKLLVNSMKDDGINKTNGMGVIALNLNKAKELKLDDDTKIELIKKMNIANLNKKDGKGNTALHLAVKKNNKKIVDALITRGVNLDIKGNKGNTALHLAVKNNKIDIVENLLRNGAHRNIPNTDTKNAEQMINRGLFGFSDEQKEIIELFKKYLQPAPPGAAAVAVAAAAAAAAAIT